MKVVFNVTDRERHEARCGRELVKSTALGTYRRGSKARRTAGWSFHYQGTVRMGEANDGASVCDLSSRI